MELTILMPCLNEAETVAACVEQARDFLQQQQIDGEVLVADNGSTDGSQALATAAGARLLTVTDRGYGNAIIAGIRAARGRYVIKGDADGSYDFFNLKDFVERLRSGDALVMGNRFTGGIDDGAMPFLHRYLGNPALSFIGRLFYGVGIGDFHCGLRGFEREAMLRLDLRSAGFEFASEMVVKAALAELRISEVPTRLAVDGRSRASHLRTWRDGWRHLRFLLLMSPRWLLLYPGLALLSLGITAELAILRGPILIDGIGFDIHTMLYASGATILGLQLMIFALLTRAVGCLKGVLPASRWFRRWLRVFTLERGLVCGAIIFVSGLLLAMTSVKIWMTTGFSALDPSAMMRWAIPSVTLMLAGAEISFASFVLSFIDVPVTDEADRDRR